MNMKISILLIEDDETVSRFVVNTLLNAGYKVLTAATGNEGIQLFNSNNPNLILLDLGLPDIEGVDVVKYIRERSNTPIIIVSARDESEDKVKALDNGADDYLTKPFSIEEFLARIRVSLRRYASVISEQDVILMNGNLQINTASQTVTVLDKEIRITPNEYKLLLYLCRNMDRVVTYNTLIKEVWGYGYDNLETLRVFMAGIRKKIEKIDSSRKYIQTHVGVGYRMMKQDKS